MAHFLECLHLLHNRFDRNMWAFKSFVVSVNVLCYLSLGIVIWALLQGLRVG
jgi:hypothetical protein